MTNAIEFAFQGARVRTVLIGVVWWFVAADVCAVLGLGHTSKALRPLDEDEQNADAYSTTSFYIQASPANQRERPLPT